MGVLKLHIQLEGVVVMLHVSAFPMHCDASRQEQGGCPGFSVTFRHVLPASQGENDGPLKLHSQLGGVRVILHVSEESGHDASSTQEHAGCPGCSVVFIQVRGYGQAANVGALKLHPQVGGLEVVLQVSALCKH